MTKRSFLIALFFVVFNLLLLIYYLMDICENLSTDLDDQILGRFLFSANFSALLLPCVIKKNFLLEITE